MPHTYRHIRFKHGNLVIGSAMLYLLLPCILFVWEVLTVPVACLTILGLLSGTILCLYTLHKYYHQTHFFSIKDIFHLVFTLAIALGVVECIGFNFHVLQSYDFVVRNPIYDMLINHDLPLYSKRGEFFVYYHAFWLPPAYICRLIPKLDPNILLYTWAYFGISISIFMLFFRFKGRILSLCIILIILSMPFRWITAFIKENPDILDRIGLFKEISLFLIGGFIKNNAYYTSFWSQMTDTFNHSIPLLILLSTVLLRKLPFHIILFFSLLLLPFTPIGALLLTPILISLFIQRIRERKIIVYSLMIALSGSLLLTSSAVYFSLSGGAGASTFFSVLPRQGNGILNSLSFLSSLSIQWILIWITYIAFKRHDSVFHKRLTGQIVCITAISSFIWIGRSDTNELMYKAGAILFPLLALYIFTNRSSHNLKPLRKILRVSLALISMVWIVYDFCHRIIPSYTWDKNKMTANKRTEWGDTLDHPEHIWYGSFWAGKVPNPHIFKVREGTKVYIPNDGGKRQ